MRTDLLPALCWLGVLLAPQVQAHDDMPIYHAMTLEAGAGQNREHQSTSNWDLDGWLGGNDHKLWLKSEGEVDDRHTESSENWAMYSYNLATFWDLQAGLRYDNRPASTSYVVMGLNGLAPYYFETEAHLFVSEEGDVSLRLRQENDLLLTQKLILKPFLEVNVQAQEVEELGVGSGLSNAELGLQLRYEISRKFAPYVEFSANRAYGNTARLLDEEGESRSGSRVTAGLRVMF